METAQSSLDATVEQVVVGRAALPAHAPDESDRLHPCSLPRLGQVPRGVGHHVGMRITVDRDSVAAGDDTDRHDHRYWIWIDRVTDDVLELSIAWFWLPARPAEPVL